VLKDNTEGGTPQTWGGPPPAPWAQPGDNRVW